MKKKVVAGLMVGALTFGIGAGVYAGTNLQEIKAYLNGDLKFELNGEGWRPKDAEGHEMLPITYDGTTYVPLRSVSSALNVPLDFNSESNTVLIGEKKEGVTFFSKNIKISYEYTDSLKDIADKKQLIFDGKQFDGAYSMTTSSWLGYYLQFDLGKSYSKLNLSLYAPDDDIEIEVQNDSKQVLSTLDLKKGIVSKFDVDLLGARKIHINPKNKNERYSTLYLLKESYVK